MILCSSRFHSKVNRSCLRFQNIHDFQLHSHSSWIHKENYFISYYFCDNKTEVFWRGGMCSVNYIEDVMSVHCICNSNIDCVSVAIHSLKWSLLRFRGRYVFVVMGLVLSCHATKNIWPNKRIPSQLQSF